MWLVGLLGGWVAGWLGCLAKHRGVRRGLKNSSSSGTCTSFGGCTRFRVGFTNLENRGTCTWVLGCPRIATMTKILKIWYMRLFPVWSGTCTTLGCCIRYMYRFSLWSGTCTTVLSSVGHMYLISFWCDRVHVPRFSLEVHHVEMA